MIIKYNYLKNIINNSNINCVFVKIQMSFYCCTIVSQKERETMPEDLIKCTVCSALFCNKKAYNVHNTYHQPDDLYVTSEQQRMQTVTKIDQDFDIRRVESAADKYILRSNIFKRSITDRTKVNHIQILLLLIISAKFEII